jgi:hypothetical protein
MKRFHYPGRWPELACYGPSVRYWNHLLFYSYDPGRNRTCNPPGKNRELSRLSYGVFMGTEGIEPSTFCISGRRPEPLDDVPACAAEAIAAHSTIPAEIEVTSFIARRFGVAKARNQGGTN